MVASELAESYYVDGNYDAALPIYEDVVASYSEDLLKIDGDHAREGRGGRYATVLLHLREMMVRRGDRDAASAYNDLFLKLYPNFEDANQKAVSQAIQITAQPDPISNLKRPVNSDGFTWRQTLLIANATVIAVILMAWIVYRVRSRRGKQ